MCTSSLLLCGMAFISMPALAQIPNGGFEDWATPPGAGYQDPVGWTTTNLMSVLFGGQPSCTQGSPGAVGSHYVTVTTQDVPGLGVTGGVITTGDLTTGAVGFPNDSRPASMTGQWQYGIQPGDSGVAVVSLYKWNSTTQTRMIVGGGRIAVGGTATGWQPMTVHITYLTADTPDSAWVSLSASGDSPVAGSFIKVDDLAFSGTASGITEQVAAMGLHLWPSPVTDRLNINAEHPMAELSVMDMTGRTVLQQSVAGLGNSTLEVQDLEEGKYLLLVRMADGQQMVRTFVKR